MLETTRLRMEPISEYDLECLKSFYSDPDCTRFVPSLSVPIDELIQNRKRHWSEHGFGTYSVKLKSNEIVGYCGIEYTADSSDTDLRFGLVKSAWGNGYTVEAAAACISQAFKSWNLEKVWGAAIPENKVSINILRAIGMEPDPHFRHYGKQVVSYSINR